MSLYESLMLCLFIYMILSIFKCEYLTARKAWNGLNCSRWEPGSNGWEDCGGAPDGRFGEPGKHTWCYKPRNLWGQRVHKCCICYVHKASKPTKHLWCYPY